MRFDQESHMMKALAAATLLAALLSAGCAGFDTGAPTSMSRQAECEGGRGGGVWVASAGACIRGGAGM